MIFQKRGAAPPLPPPGLPLARGARTVIRTFDREDLDAWMEWPRHSDPLFRAYDPPELSPRQADAYFKSRAAGPDSRQFGVDNHQRLLVGRISLRDIHWGSGYSVLGISFHPEHLGQGLGTDSLRAFLGYYFDTMHMQTLDLDVAGHNGRAQRVYQKLGFQIRGQRWGDLQTDLAGVFHHNELAPYRSFFRREFGLIRPLVLDMRLTAAEWRPPKAGPSP